MRQSKNKAWRVIWSLGVMGAGLWLAPSGVAFADPSQYAQVLKDKLSLSDTQVQQVESILSTADAQLGPKPAENASPQDRQAYYQKMHEAMQNTQNSINGVLTDQQKTQYAEMKTQRHGRGGEWRHGRGEHPWNPSAGAQTGQAVPNGNGFWQGRHHHGPDGERWDRDQD